MRSFLLAWAFMTAFAANAQNDWTQRADCPGASRQSPTSFTIGNKLYVGLGWDFTTYYNDFYEYDPATNAWIQIANFPGHPRHAAVGFSIGNKGYVGTGYDGSIDYRDFYEYDPVTNAWTQKANFMGASRSQAIGFAVNGKGYIGTGTASVGTTYFGDMYAYNPVTDSWTQKNSFGGTGRRSAQCFVIGDYAYVGTGQGSNGHGATFYQYDPSLDSWTQKANFMGGGRSGCTAFSIAGEGYIGGGYNGTTYTALFYKYSPTLDTWTSIASFTGGARAYCIGQSVNGYGYLFFGRQVASPSSMKRDLWRYTPTLVSETSSTVIGCAGGNDGAITIHAYGGVPPYTYVWSHDAQETANTAEGLSAGDYSVLVTDNLDNTLEIHVTIADPEPFVAEISSSGSTSFCQGNSVTLSANPAESYLWSTGATTQTISVFTSGNYSLIAVNANGCADTSVATTVTVNPLPDASVILDGATTFCAGSSVLLSADPGNTYLWNTGSTDQDISVFASGSYSVTVTNIHGCSQTSSSIPVVVNPLPDAVITSNGSMVLCTGGSVTLVSNIAAGYLWSTGDITSSIHVTEPGNYTVTTEDVNGCYQTSQVVVITENPLPDAVITPSGATTFCQGGSVVLSSNTADSYLWSTGQTSPGITVSTPGNYTVQTTVNGCSRVSPITIVAVNPLPDAVITPSGATTFCQGESVVLSSGAADSYLWSTGQTSSGITVSTPGNYTVQTTVDGCSRLSSITVVAVNPLPDAVITPNGATTFCQGGSVMLSSNVADSYLWSTNQTTQNITVSTPGNYTVQTTVNGCSRVSSIVVVAVNPLPDAVITPNGATTFCEGGSVVLTANPSTGYLWSNGETTASIQASTTGNFSVTTTNSNGCTNVSSPTAVVVHSVPMVPTITASGHLLTSSSPTGNQWYLNGDPINNATGQNFTAIEDGNYSVKVTNANGCSSVSVPFLFSDLGVASIHESLGILIAPNPNDGHFTLLSENIQEMEVTIFNVAGEMVFHSGQLIPGSQIDLSLQPKGLYVVQIRSGAFLINKRVVIGV